MLRRFFTYLIFICLVSSCNFKKNTTILDIDGYQLNSNDLQYVLKNISSSFDEEISRLKNNSDLLKKWTVDQLINEQILVEEANKRNIQIDPDELKKSSGIEDSTLSPNPETKFINERIKRKLLSQKAINALLKENVHVSDEEILDYYQKKLDSFKLPDQCRFRQIMVTEKDKALEAKAKINEGLDFISAVEEYDESAYKEKGGDTGFIDRQLLPAFLGKACDMLNIGEISDVMESPYGYCIVTLIDRREPKTLSFDENKEVILNDLRQTKGQIFLNEWLEKRRKKIVTVINWEAIGEISY